MKQKFFVLGAIALIAVVGLFVFEHATSAQRPDRNSQPGEGQRGERPGGDRGGRNMMGMFNATSFVDNSWLDLSFKVKVGDETLIKARSIHQAARDKLETKIKKIVESGDMRAGFAEFQTFRVNTIKELSTSLKEVLTQEEFAALTKSLKEREAAEQARRNRFRGGGQGGQGGQRGQRPSQ